jgi:hypothetical protein
MKSTLWRNVRDRLTWHDGASARNRGKRWSTQLSLERLEDRNLLTVTDMTQLAQLYPTHSGPTLLLRNFDGGYNDDSKDVIAPWACADRNRQPSCPRPSGNRGRSSGTASRTRWPKPRARQRRRTSPARNSSRGDDWPGAFFSKTLWPLFQFGGALAHVRPNAELLTTQTAGEFSLPSQALTGPAKPRRSVCAPPTPLGSLGKKTPGREGIAGPLSHCPIVRLLETSNRPSAR